MHESPDQFRTALVISSFVDDSPGLTNNGQPLRLLDVAVMPAGFHPDTFVDSSPPLPGPRECDEIRLVQPPYWIDRDRYGDARGHGLENWDLKFGEFMQTLFVGKANERPYVHPATPLPEAPTRWHVPIYVRWDWTPTAYQDSFRMEESFMHSGEVASELLRERLSQAPRSLTRSLFGAWIDWSGSSVNNTIKSSYPHHGTPIMSEWIVADRVDPNEECNIAIDADNFVEISDAHSKTRSRLRMVIDPIADFRTLVNMHQRIDTASSVAVRLNVLANREVVVTEVVLFSEARGHRPAPLEHPFQWFGSNDAGRPHHDHKIYRSIKPS
jgi:hypothetical protein